MKPPYIAWAYENQIADGVSSTNFGATEPLSRKEMATFLAKDAVYSLQATEILSGMENNNFKPQQTTLRYQVAKAM